jgi:hypothetical protein
MFVSVLKSPRLRVVRAQFPPRTVRTRTDPALTLTYNPNNLQRHIIFGVARGRNFAGGVPRVAPGRVRPGALLAEGIGMKRGTLVFILVLCAVCSGAWPGATSYAKQRASQRVTGTVYGFSGRLAGRSYPFSLIVNNYSSADDAARLAAAAGSQDELLSALGHMNAGRIAIGNNVGVTANAVFASPTAEGGTKLTVLFERNVNFFELRYGTRSSDYRFGYAEIYLDRAGRGQGTFIPAARVRVNGNNWEVEDFGVYPARLMGLRASGSVGGAR